MALLAVPSWVIPGTYAENLRFLENKNAVRAVELLFFMYDNDIQQQLDSEWEQICFYKNRFIFTAHLPELLLPAHESLISRLAPLVRHFIVHPSVENPAAQASLLGEWTERYGAAFLIENIFSNKGISHKNTPPLSALFPCLSADTGLCMDTGHLLLEGQNPADFFRTWGKRIGEIHLHGLDREQAAIDGRLIDHRRLNGSDPWLIELLPLLRDFQGIINLEVFSWEEACAGIAILEKILT